MLVISSHEIRPFMTTNRTYRSSDPPNERTSRWVLPRIWFFLSYSQDMLGPLHYIVIYYTSITIQKSLKYVKVKLREGKIRR